MLAKRKYRDRLPVPQDKTGLVIGRRRPPVFMEKQGISAKTHPIHVSWSRPNYMQSCNAEISGDVGGLETLGLEEIDLSQPTVELLDSQVRKGIVWAGVGVSSVGAAGLWVVRMIILKKVATSNLIYGCCDGVY